MWLFVAALIAVSVIAMCVLIAATLACTTVDACALSSVMCGLLRLFGTAPKPGTFVWIVAALCLPAADAVGFSSGSSGSSSDQGSSGSSGDQGTLREALLSLIVTYGVHTVISVSRGVIGMAVHPRWYKPYVHEETAPATRRRCRLYIAARCSFLYLSLIHI